MSGQDVVRLQKKLGIQADGDYGRVTAQAVHHSKYLLGFPPRAFDTGASVFYQELLYGKHKRNAEYLRRAKARQTYIEKQRAKAAKGAAAGRDATAWLMARMGRTEVAPGHGYGPNRNPEWLDDWQVRNGHAQYHAKIEAGWPWCGVALWAAWTFGAGLKVPGEFRSVEWLYWNAKANDYGLYVIALADVRPGDLLVLFGQDVHVGMARARYDGGSTVPTIEGNTSFDDGGDQANGGAIAARHRNVGDVVLPIRVRT